MKQVNKIKQVKTTKQSKNVKTKTRIIWICVATAMFSVMLFGFQRVLMPKYMSGVFEGLLIGEYYKSSKAHDVIFLGDCEVYDNISPVALWENFGITSYVRGSPQQLVWHSYYLLEDTLRYEKPEFVFYSVPAMKQNEPRSEAYNRLTLDGMRLSPTKLRALSASMTESEEKITYLLPILRYHDRWRELGSDDFRFFFGSDRVSHNGYMMRADIKPADFVPPGAILPGYDFGENAMLYLDKIKDLCEKNEITLILIKTPSLHPFWYDEWDEQIISYAEKNNLHYVNSLKMQDEIGLDFSTDTYNGGLSLNIFGATKFSNFLGRFLTENFEITDHRETPKYVEIWDKKRQNYYEMLQNQISDMEYYGIIKSFTFKP